MTGRRARALALLAAAALAASCAHLPERNGGPAVAFVERDAAWGGEVRVDGIVHVRKGATLTIRPGTRVAFVPARFGTGEEHEGFAASGLKVEGRIVAEGTEEQPIVFTAAGRAPSPGSWDKILFTFSSGNRFDHCIFEGARYAFHAHFSEIAVRRSLFRDNEEGVRLGQSRPVIDGFIRQLMKPAVNILNPCVLIQLDRYGRAFNGRLDKRPPVASGHIPEGVKRQVGNGAF